MPVISSIVIFDELFVLFVESIGDVSTDEFEFPVAIEIGCDAIITWGMRLVMIE